MNSRILVSFFLMLISIRGFSQEKSVKTDEVMIKLFEKKNSQDRCKYLYQGKVDLKVKNTIELEGESTAFAKGKEKTTKNFKRGVASSLFGSITSFCTITIYEASSLIRNQTRVRDKVLIEKSDNVEIIRGCKVDDWNYRALLKVKKTDGKIYYVNTEAFGGQLRQENFGIDNLLYCTSHYLEPKEIPVKKEDVASTNTDAKVSEAHIKTIPDSETPSISIQEFKESGKSLRDDGLGTHR